MSIDVTDLVHSLGINVATTGQNRPSSYVSNQGGQASKPASGGFVSNIAHSAGSIVGGLASGAAHSIGKSFSDVAQGITQGLPGHGSIHANQTYVNHSMDQLAAAHKTYAKQYSQGKISKDRYNNLLKDLGSQYGELSDQSKKNAKTVSAKDFATGLATVGTLPLAAGRLVAPGIAAKAPVLASSTSRGLAASAALAPAKLALNYALPAQSAAELPGQIQKGQLGRAAVNVATLASPLAIAGAAGAIPKIAKAAGEAVYGRNAGPVKAFFGDKAVNDAIKANPKLQPVLKQAEEFTKDQPGVKKGQKPDQFFKSYLSDTLGLNPENTTVQQFAERFGKYAKPVEKLNELKAAGKAHPQAVLTADYGVAVPQAIQRSGADLSMMSGVEKAKLAQKVTANIENPTAADHIKNVIFGANSTDEVKTGLKSLDKLPGAKIEGFNAPKGFKVTFGPKQQANLTALKDVSGELDSGKKALPVLGAIGQGLEKSGLSTQSHSTETYAKYKANLGEELGKLGLNPEDVITKLKEYANGRGGFGVFDERQLGTHAMKQALGVDDSKVAGNVRQAILKAYDKMSLGDLGVAGKVENALYKVPGYGQYRRIQGIGRYEANPFFRLQSGVEAELLSQNAAKGKGIHLPGTNNLMSKIFPGKTDELESIAKKVKTQLDEGFTSQGASDNALGVITAKTTRTQEMALGGLVKTLAEKSGQPVDDFLEHADQAVLDNIRSVVQYPRQGFTSSNFAKTLNLVAFPARYNVKLVGIAGKALADMPPLMQIGTLKGLSNFLSFLSSDEGIKWKSDNSELIGIVNYLNPYNNIGKILSGLKNGDVQVSDFGLIGGLPLGIITQAIKTQSGGGSTPYQSPKTGEILPDKIPANDAARLKLFLTDVVNSMYSYSGRSFGFNNSKKDLTGSLPLLKTGKDETKAADQKATPYQQRVQKVLGQKNATSAAAPTKPVQRFATQFGNTPTTGGAKTNVGALVQGAKKLPKGKRPKVKAFRPRAL